jgi:hypothetical protein
VHRMSRVVAVLAALALALAYTPPAQAGNPWEELMGRKPRVWTDPEGRFSLDLPLGWKADTSEPAVPKFSRVDEDSGLAAGVAVEVRTVPAGVKLGHFVSRVEEEVRGAVRNVTILEQDKLEISGTQGVRRLMTYQEKGHAEMRHEVVQVYFIVAERAFIVTLETAVGGRGRFWEEFNVMMRGMSAAAPGEEIRPPRPGEPRKKVRAGEMINPDAAPY